jgi:hypothetical protein
MAVLCTPTALRTVVKRERNEMPPVPFAVNVRLIASLLCLIPRLLRNISREDLPVVADLAAIQNVPPHATR